MICLLIVLQTGFDNCYLPTNPRCKHLQHIYIQKFIQPIQRSFHFCIRLQVIHLIILQQQIFRLLERRKTKRDISCRIFNRDRLQVRRTPFQKTNYIQQRILIRIRPRFPDKTKRFIIQLHHQTSIFQQ